MYKFLVNTSILLIGIILLSEIKTPLAVKVITFIDRDIEHFQLINVLGMKEGILDEVSCCRQCRMHNQCEAVLYQRTTRSCTLGRGVGPGMTGSERDLHLFAMKKGWCPVEHGYQVFSIQDEELCVKMSNIKLNFTDARAECQKHGGDLYHMDEPNCHMYGEDSMDKSRIRIGAFPIFLERLQPKYSFWIGLTDEIQEGTFAWTFNGKSLSPAELRALNWKPDQPNNLQSENCVMSYHTFPQINDSDCSNKFYFLCEILL